MSRVSLERTPKRRVAIGEPLWPGALEKDLSNLVRLHLAQLPWCRFWINKERFIARVDGSTTFVPGLAEGSGDLIGVVQRCAPVVGHGGRVLGYTLGGYSGWGIFTAIELKQPGSHTKPKADQVEWMRLVKDMGGVAGWGNTLRAAMDIVASARGVPVDYISDEIEERTGKRVVDS